MNDSLTGDFQTQIVQQIAAHQPRLRAFVRCLMVPSCDVDDLVQEINAVLWEKADRYDPNSDFWAWASQIARFKTLNHVRKRKREPIVFDDQVLSRLADVAEQRL
ncbi:MAG: sigma-70 family RNA polymerase sigma factor, partial [Planctomycetota bacterium]